MPDNVIIGASAGTGKTFALATRMMRLMLLGSQPNEMVALTFSRAAAGEIFDKLANRLATAAASDKAAEEESDNIFSPAESDSADNEKSNYVFAEQSAYITKHYGNPIKAATFAKLLRSLINTQHLSMIGTIDSFMMRMVRMFPLEVGIQGNVTIMDPYRESCERAKICDDILLGQIDPKAIRALADAFRLAMSGSESKSYAQSLINFIKTWHSKMLMHQDEKAWGDKTQIWPNGCPFSAKADLSKYADKLLTLQDDKGTILGEDANWQSLVADVRNFDGSFGGVSTPMKNLLSHVDPSATTTIEFSINRRVRSFSGDAAALLRDTVSAMFAKALDIRLNTMMGLYRLMSLFENRYAESVRARGLLTFNDIPRMISTLDANIRMALEYRFDGKFCHWALDEFQDTSHEQWDVLNNLVDEARQGEDHSVFIVGDNKQAIYGWRNGDVAIFETEQDSGKYNNAFLWKSYRYGTEIATFVNRVFNGELLKEFCSDEPAIKRWTDRWKDHESVSKYSACVKIIDAAKIGARQFDYITPVVDELTSTRYWERGWTCAVLVRDNTVGQKLGDALRANGIPAVWEGESAICDTPAVSAFTHLLVLAEHPLNSLAYQHVMMSPLADALWPGQKPTPAAAAKDILERITRDGIAQTIANIVTTLPKDVWCDDGFTRNRIDATIRAATIFETTAVPEAGISDFAAFLQQQTKRDYADASTVKIMTIHRSKGLGFDFVILPLIEKDGLTAGKPDPLECDRWILENPGVNIVANDTTLANVQNAMHNKEIYEKLCVYYVAMTRSRHALTLITKPESQSGNTVYISTLVRAAFAKNQSIIGDTEWYKKPRKDNKSKRTLPQLEPPPRKLRKRIDRATPSAHQLVGMTADRLFAQHELIANGADRGTRIHESLSTVEWLTADNFAQPADVAYEDADLTKPSPFRDALMKPAGTVDLWRERSFELLTQDGRWISGTFDRVTFTENNGMRFASIFDYKTNAVRDGETADTFAERMRSNYSCQLMAYRDAVSTLTGIAPKNIRTVLLLTATMQCVDLTF